MRTLFVSSLVTGSWAAIGADTSAATSAAVEPAAARRTSGLADVGKDTRFVRLVVVAVLSAFRLGSRKPLQHTYLPGGAVCQRSAVTQSRREKFRSKLIVQLVFQ